MFASRFDFTYRFIDDVLPIKNQDFKNNLGQMYPDAGFPADSRYSNGNQLFPSSMVDTGILSNNTKFLSHEC